MKKENHINHVIRDFIDGNLTASERKKFLESIRSNRNSKDLEKTYETIFAQIETLSDAEVESLHTLLERETKSKGILARLRPMMKYAAIFVLAGGLFFLYQWNQSVEEDVVLAHVEKTHLSKHRLPDGSEITLYGNSTFDILEFSEESRTVLLHGEATFLVVPSKIPFYVQTATGYFTKVLGTQFTVRETTDSYRVAVERGRVFVGKGEETLGILSKGDSLAVDGEVHLFSSEGNPLIFDNMNLEDVVRMVNQAYDTEVQLAASLDGKVKCTAVFEKQLSITEIVDILCEMYGYTYAISGHKIIIQ